MAIPKIMLENLCEQTGASGYKSAAQAYLNKDPNTQKKILSEIDLHSCFNSVERFTRWLESYISSGR